MNPVDGGIGAQDATETAENQTLTQYPGNALEQFGNGCLIDMRVRVAITLLSTSPRYSPITPVAGSTLGVWPPEETARDALDLATALLRLGAERGLVHPIPDDGELSPGLRGQAKRNAAFQVLTQMEGQKFAQAEADRVVPAAPIIGARKMN